MALLFVQDSFWAFFLGLLFSLGPNALPATNTTPISLDEAHIRAQASDAITSANWQQHPKIKAVRNIVESVNAEVRKGALKILERKSVCGDCTLPGD